MNPACRGRSKWFFAAPYEGPRMREVRIMRARMICATCEMFDACRELGRDEPYGIFAGQTAGERGFKNGERRGRRGRPRKSA